jgi:hypothetical protein
VADYAGAWRATTDRCHRFVTGVRALLTAGTASGLGLTAETRVRDLVHLGGQPQSVTI